jgi:hypothetical protein
MQELKNDILIEKELGFIGMGACKRIIDYIDNLYLEKEKEQIIDAHCCGWSDCFDFWENKESRMAEKYYNETYNQNK